MKKVLLTTDSACDMPNELFEKYGIKKMPFHIVLGVETYQDGVNITPDDIYDYVAKEKVLPKTGAPSIDDFVEFFGEQLKDNDCELVHITISGECSSSYNFARIAAGEFDGRVQVIDSRNLSSGQAVLVLKAVDLISEGLSAVEVKERIDAISEKTNTSFVVDKLDYLAKGGRCSMLANLAGKALGIRPMLVLREGKILAGKKYIISKMDKIALKYLEDLKEMYPNYDKKRCILVNSTVSEEMLSSMKEKIKNIFDFEEIIEAKAGCVITSHCGKGSIGFMFIGE